MEGDPLADAAFQWLKSHPVEYQKFAAISTNSEIAFFSRGFDALSGLCASFQSFDATLLQRLIPASQVFEKYTTEILTVLGLYSLPYCYAGANGARVLVQSRKIMEEPATRLADTARFVFDVCQRDAFSATGRGLVAILKVRLLHAAARHYASPAISDETPVNQEDMVGTMLAFSLILVRGLRKMGVQLSDVEVIHYYELWKVVGRLLGIAPGCIPETIRAASVRDREIRRREFRRSPEGVALTSVLVEYLQTQRAQLNGINPADLMYYLLGKDTADLLGVSPGSRLTSEVIGVGLRMKNFFKDFSDTHFTQLIRELEKNNART